MENNGRQEKLIGNTFDAMSGLITGVIVGVVYSLIFRVIHFFGAEYNLANTSIPGFIVGIALGLAHKKSATNFALITGLTAGVGIGFSSATSIKYGTAFGVCAGFGILTVFFVKKWKEKRNK